MKKVGIGILVVLCLLSAGYSGKLFIEKQVAMYRQQGFGAALEIKVKRVEVEGEATIQAEGMAGKMVVMTLMQKPQEKSKGK